jgi:hypothetical protein
VCCLELQVLLLLRQLLLVRWFSRALVDSAPVRLRTDSGSKNHPAQRTSQSLHVINKWDTREHAEQNIGMGALWVGWGGVGGGGGGF